MRKIILLLIVGLLGYVSIYFLFHSFLQKNRNIKIQKTLETKREVYNQKQKYEKEKSILITKNDCKNDCKTKVFFVEEYSYCREFCGLNEAKDTINKKNESIDACDDSENILEEDICWRKKAINEKKDKYCDKISDEKLSEICKDRVLEEIIN